MESPRIIPVLNPSDAPKARAGYALIVVLFSLTVLTLIFGASSARTIAHIEQVQSNALILKRAHDAARMAELVMRADVNGPNLEGRQSPIVMDGITLQPATGLIDLNTASPALLRLFLEGYRLPDGTIREALEKYRAWRRQGRTLLRVSDFRRVTGLTVNQLPGLDQFATVYSGRTGIAVAQAPLALLQHLMGPEERVVLKDRIAPELTSVGSEINQYLVRNHTVVAVHLGGPSRILGLPY